MALTTDKIAYGTYTAMTVTNLQSLAYDSTDPYGSWQSDIVDNRTTLAIDYEVAIFLSTAASAPAEDKAGYIYVCPWVHTGAAWLHVGGFGTTTAPTGSEGTASVSDPNSMRGPYSLPYKITSQGLRGFISIASMCSGIVPDGWSLAIRNHTGANFSTGCVVAYRAISFTNS